MAPEKKAQEKMAQEKKAQGKNGTGKNGTKCRLGKNGTIFFLYFLYLLFILLLKTEINKFFKLYILLTKKMEKGRQKPKRSP